MVLLSPKIIHLYNLFKKQVLDSSPVGRELPNIGWLIAYKNHGMDKIRCIITDNKCNKYYYWFWHML